MNSLKLKIYQIVDSFLVEAKTQDGRDRSLHQLNADRHLAVDAIQKAFKDLIEEMPTEFPERESDEYDKAYADAKNYLLSKL